MNPLLRTDANPAPATEIPFPEFDLICSCATARMTPDRVARVNRLVEDGVDWTALLRQAEHHGVTALVARNLTACPDRVPPAVANALRAAFTTNLQRNLWFASEMVRILEHLRSREIKTVPYKGPVLAETAYGDVALRSFGDLDFLIAPSDLLRAKAALAEIGYRPSKPQTPAEDRFWLRTGYECSFDGAAGKYLVELQWRLLPHIYAVDLHTEDLHRRAVMTTFSGQPLLTLSPEDNFLVLCVHAAKHLWMRLIWLCDIAETMRTQTIDYSELAARARELGVLRIVEISTCLANILLGAEKSAALDEAFAKSAQTHSIASTMERRLVAGASYDFHSTDYFRWIFRLRERRTDAWRYTWRLIWTPGEGDLAALKLPAVLFPLYRAVRLARLTRKIA